MAREYIDKYISPSEGTILPLDQYRQLIENSPDIIFLIDPKGNFLFINSAAQKITGYSKNQLLTRSLFNFIHPEEKKNLQQKMAQAIEFPEVFFVPVTFSSANNTLIPLEITLKPLKIEKIQTETFLGIARDVTEQKKWAESLRKEIEKYATLIEKAKDGIVIIQDGLCKFANKAVEEIFGYSINEIQQKKFFDWLPSEEKDLIKERYRSRMLQKSVPSVYETKIKCKNGEIKDIEISASLIEFEGRPADMGILRDITERKRIEKELREAKQKFQHLVENVNHVIFTLDQEGKFSYINPVLEKYGSFKADSLLGKPFLDLVHPDDRHHVEEVFKKISEGTALSFEFRLMVDQKEFRHFRAFCRSIEDNGQPRGLMGIASDITERKKAAEELSQAYQEVERIKSQLKAIIDNAPNLAIQWINAKGEITFWNPQSEALFGLPEKEVLGKHFADIFFSGKQKEEFTNLLQEVFEQQKSFVQLEQKIKKKSGETAYVLMSIFPIFPEDNDPLAVAMEIDITPQYKAQKNLITMNQQLEKFSLISAELLTIENEEKFFKSIAEAIVSISDFKRVLISYFIPNPPYRRIIATYGIKKEDIEKVQSIHMPKEKYLAYFREGIKLGHQSCYIPHDKKAILDPKAIIPGRENYPEQPGGWHKEDGLLVAMKDTKGEIIGIISVDDSKSGRRPTDETVRPLEIFANFLSEALQKRILLQKIKSSEEKFRSLVCNLKTGILRISGMGVIIEANPAALEMLKLESKEISDSFRFSDLFFSLQDFAQFMKELEINNQVKNKELRLCRKNHEVFWASLTATAIKNKSGQIIYFDTVIDDISERKKLEEEIKRLSIIDELTGVYNRRYFNRQLPEEIKTAERWRSSLSLIMLDIDDFKSYNDTYHHLEGDEVIKELACTILENIRKEYSYQGEREEKTPGDWVSRFGGDEFAIILPGQTTKEAFIVAERIRKKFENLTFNPEGQRISKTISLGIAQCFFQGEKSREGQPKPIPRAYFEKKASELVCLADKALYQAKNTGKNRTIIAQESVELRRAHPPFRE
ncbi:PAS domain S-box protein [Candidatus Aminicenantes bacterium AC-334-K16]|jgi:diguanylate cyclase (GGDEF)-like protein/PAS domain S-box-containing protein|nr:PAS domain S-box protein [Candidatus Aminicenantes bacterium AC-334-K16]